MLMNMEAVQLFSFQLNPSHTELLNEMNLLAQNVIEINGRKRDDFKIGYHASPSMQRLHLHVLSKDFESPCLKTKIHWNSFNTEFFLSTDCMYRTYLLPCICWNTS